MPLSQFKQRFGETTKRTKTYFAPGRVNLIGEHIDYNGGTVMPFALSQGIKATVRFDPNSRHIRIASTETDTMLDVNLESQNKFERRQDAWQNYPLGVLHYLSEQLGIPLIGADIMLHSSLPLRSGLSSSAAIEVLTAYMFLHQAKHQLADNKSALAQLCQKVENEFIGVQCGIMDQFAVAASRKDHAVLLQCQSMQHEYIPLQLDDVCIVVLNSNKPRSLSESKYNERRQECDEALHIIQMHRELPNLSAANLSDLKYLKNATLEKRLQHIISENLSVAKAVQCLKSNNWHGLGLLLKSSHKSLQKNYEVSCYELDTLTQLCNSHLACYGSRMTGAGFGGCAIALVEKKDTEDFIEYVKQNYTAKTGLPLDAYISSAEKGVHLV